MMKLWIGLLACIPLSAFGATTSITYDDPKCSAFEISGTAGNFTLKCATTTTPPEPIPGGPWPLNCPGFTRTVNVDLGWPAMSTTTLYTPQYGGFKAGDLLAIRIVPPAGSISISGKAGSLSLAEYAAPAAMRYAVLTTSPCDFTGEAGYTDSFTIPIKYEGTISISISPIQVNRKQAGTAINLLPGVTYYLLVKNTAADGTTPTCSGACDMVIQFTRPPLQTTARKSKKK